MENISEREKIIEEIRDLHEKIRNTGTHKQWLAANHHVKSVNFKYSPIADLVKKRNCLVSLLASVENYHEDRKKNCS